MKWQQKTAETRLKELYKFYFNQKLPINRLEVIEADVTKKNIGLTQAKYKEISKSVDLVINTAANVSIFLLRFSLISLSASLFCFLKKLLSDMKKFKIITKISFVYITVDNNHWPW